MKAKSFQLDNIVRNYINRLINNVKEKIDTTKLEKYLETGSMEGALKELVKIKPYTQKDKELFARIYRAIKNHLENRFSKTLSKEKGINIVSNQRQRKLWDNAVNESVNYITSIPLEFKEDFEKQLESYLRGEGAVSRAYLQKWLESKVNLSKKRSKMIIADQSKKITKSYARAQMAGNKIYTYVWHTVEDRAVRARHRHLERSKQDTRKPPIVGYTKKRGYYRGNPGDDYNCRCYEEYYFNTKNKKGTA